MDTAVVVLDNGSGFLKAGLHTDEEPTVVAPQLVGRPRHKRMTSNVREAFVGRRAATMSGVCALSSPSERGFIRSFDDQGLIFEDLFENQLGVEPCDHAVMLSRLPSYCRDQEIHLTAELFERFYIPALVKKSDCVLSLMDVGLLMGTVVDCGDTVCHTSAVYGGEIVLNTERLLRLGGKDVSESLARIVRRETGFYATSKYALDHISRIKEGLQGLKEAWLRRRRSLRRGCSLRYALPDGQEIQVRAESMPELYKAGELLFEPTLLGVQGTGLTGMLMATLTNAPSLLHDTLIQNVVLCGGSCLLSGLKERLTSEVKSASGMSLELRIAPRPQFAVWRGGAVLSGLSTFSSMSVTRDDYFEEGSFRVEHKFC